MDFEASPLTISTCTVITQLNDRINLPYLTRFINVYNLKSPLLDLKSGGIYDIEYYGNCARGQTLVDKIKDEFNNQATIRFKYWGFRTVNIKLFANGRLQMTGLKYENEANDIAKLIIDIITKININIQFDIDSFIDNQIISEGQAVFRDFQIVYHNGNIYYYRKNYNRFLINFRFDIDKEYNNIISNKQKIELSDINNNLLIKNNRRKNNEKITIGNYNFNVNNKLFEFGIHDVYEDKLIKENNNLHSKLIDNQWYYDDDILKIIDKIEIIKIIFRNDMEKILNEVHNIIELRLKVLDIGLKYNDFHFNELEKLLKQIELEIIPADDEVAFTNTKNKIYQFIQCYQNLLDKRIYRLVMIRTLDISICNKIKEYLIANPNIIQSLQNNKSFITLPLSKIEFMNNIDPINPIDKDYSYFISNTETVLINSDLSVNFNINLKKLIKILKVKGLFNTYEPDDHSGINVHYYYNSDNYKNNMQQGYCYCNPHCSTKEKKSICTKITILIFRPGSIIITGSRSTTQLKEVYKLIISILKDNMNIIKVDDKPEDNKHIALLNNEFRKVSRKPRLFYIKKKDIIFNPIIPNNP
jgi:TATA-box binding protein (TBP) (component of TFIID and TFIIIB)